MTEAKEKMAKKSNSFNRIGRSIVSILDGSFLTKENVTDNIPYLGFLFAMGLLYISNSFYAERNLRQSATLTRQLKELKSEFITVRSELMFVSKQSEVAKAVSAKGLYESVVPPKKIIVEPEQLEQ
jgi:hypothetical protein